ALPGLPILWKTVQQDDQAAVLRTRLSHMEQHAIYVDARKFNVHHVSSCTRACVAGPRRKPTSQQYFCVTPPSVHQMVLALERGGFIRRQPGVARSIEILFDPKLLPELPVLEPTTCCSAQVGTVGPISDLVSVKGLADTEGDQNQRNCHQHPTGMGAARPPKVTESAKQVEAADEYPDREPHIPL